MRIWIPEPQCLAALDTLIKGTRADFGNLQLLNPQNGALQIVAQRGFSGEFLEYFSSVHENQAACGTAMASARPVVVDDVLTSPIFAEDDLQRVMVRADVRAVHSTPLIGRDGRLLGIASVHFRVSHRPDASELRIVDAFAREFSHYADKFGQLAQRSDSAVLRSVELRARSGSPAQDGTRQFPPDHAERARLTFTDVEVCEDSSLIGQLNASGLDCERCEGGEPLVAILRIVNLSTTLGICGECYRDLIKLALGSVA